MPIPLNWKFLYISLFSIICQQYLFAIPQTWGIGSIDGNAPYESTLKLSHLSLHSFDQLVPSFTVYIHSDLFAVLK